MNTCSVCFCIHNEIVGKGGGGVTDLQTIYYKYTKYRTFLIINNKTKLKSQKTLIGQNKIG